jgi:hypothetical protein
VKALDAGDVSGAQAKEILPRMLETGQSLREVVAVLVAARSTTRPSSGASSPT